MWTQSLLKDCIISRVANEAAAGTSAVTSSVVDMSDWDGITFVALLGTVTDNSILTLTGKENTANSTSSPTPVAPATFATSAITAATSSNTIMVVEIYRPLLRYVFCALTRTAQNAEVGGIIAIRWRGRVNPVTIDTSVLASALATGV